MKECKRHRWRVGSSNARLKGKKIIKYSLNIWCENCNKKVRAYYNSTVKFKKRSLNKTKKSVEKKQ